MAKDPDSGHTIHRHEKRLVSGATLWWVEHSPNGYRYYCIHDTLLTAPCDKCDQNVLKFMRKYKHKKRAA